MKQKILLLNNLLSARNLNKILAVVCVLLLFVSIVPHVLPHARANGSITVSNVVFDPTTGYIAFDYTSSDNLTGTASTIDIDDTTGATTYWDNLYGGTCTSSHCYGTLGTIEPDSSVTSVKIRVKVGSTTDDSQTINYPLPLPTTNTPQTPIAGGWIGVGETWTYASADSPTYTFTVSGDETDRYSPGMRIKLTQSSTTKYFIITAVSYSSPNTTVTVYGGTDYTLANSTISNTYYSMQKAPQGFPLDPAKWTVQVKDSNEYVVSSPTQNTWYNMGSLSITIPVGVWQVRTEYAAVPGNNPNNVNLVDMDCTLSTTTNSETDTDFTTFVLTRGATYAIQGGSNVSREKTLNLSSKTTYYLDCMTFVNTGITLDVNGGAAPTILRATSAYL